MGAGERRDEGVGFGGIAQGDGRELQAGDPALGAIAQQADLRARQQQIFEQFESQLDLLRVGEAFRDVAGQVRDVMRRYREYIDAGGDLARANEFLSRSLEQIRSDASLALAEGEQQAASKLAEAAAILAGQPGSMELRYLNSLQEIAGDRTNTIVFPMQIADLARQFGR